MCLRMISADDRFVSDRESFSVRHTSIDSRRLRRGLDRTAVAGHAVAHVRRRDESVQCVECVRRIVHCVVFVAQCQNCIRCCSVFRWSRCRRRRQCARARAHQSRLCRRVRILLGPTVRRTMLAHIDNHRAFARLIAAECESVSNNAKWVWGTLRK